MILEEETFEAFGYYPKDLKSQSNKHILAACDDCGKVRLTTKNGYRSLCPSCAMKGNMRNSGNTATDKTKAKLSAALKGNTNCLGNTATDKTKALMSIAQKGNKNAFRGGKKVVNARKRAKRKRDLGYTLLMPFKKGEDGHHVTNEYVIGVPTEVHRSFNYNSRKKHRTRVLQWLKDNDKKKYKIVLCVLAKEPLRNSN
jgi:hypothetical protein